MNYYNEIDTHVAQWLRNLIDAGLIPQGDVDARSIQEVTPNDLKGYTQCHCDLPSKESMACVSGAGYRRQEDEAASISKRIRGTGKVEGI